MTRTRLPLAVLALVTAGVAQAQGKYADVNGIRMYYEVHGTGQPLVLIHGGGSTIQSSFGRLMPELAKTHRIIAVELQAHGRTSDRKAPESFEQDADDVAALLQQLGVARADILGFSNGGSTALQVGIRHPERVRKLVAVAAIYKRDGMARGFWSMMEKATFNDMPQPLKDAFLRVNPDREKLLVMFTKDRQRMLSFKDWKERAMKSITAPVLVVAGDRDVVRAEHAVEMARVLPHARLVILPGVHGEAIGESTTPQNSKVFPLFVALVEEFLAAPAP
jgi:pimeloyl-ACP methyl ester carboxylesterase